MHALRRLSSSTGRSIAALIRDGVEQYLLAQKADTRQHQVERALRVAGKFSSGRKNVGAKHDDYLAGDFRR